MRDLALHDRAPDTHHLTSTGRHPGSGRRAASRGTPTRIAAHERNPLVARLAPLVLAAMLGLGSPAGVLADDPTQAPGVPAGPPSCAERFPAEGPAGVDLRLGCIVSEVVGLYTAGQSAPPPPLSTYATVVAALVLATVIAVWLAGRFVARRAGRRMAPVLAAEWWICASCRSVNGAGVARCYSCGSGRPDGPMLTTDEHPEIAQSFGSTRKRG